MFNAAHAQSLRDSLTVVQDSVAMVQDSVAAALQDVQADNDYLAYPDSLGIDPGLAEYVPDPLDSIPSNVRPSRRPGTPLSRTCVTAATLYIIMVTCR